MTYSEFPAITKTTPANHVPEVLQPQHSIITPEGCYMSNFIRQNEVKMANESLKVEKPLLESSSEMNKLQCIPNTEHSPDTKITVMGTRLPAQKFWAMTENWSAKILVEGPQKCNILFPRSSGKKILQNLYRNSLNICKDPCRSAVVLT